MHNPKIKIINSNLAYSINKFNKTPTFVAYGGFYIYILIDTRATGCIPQ
jgi:hypothetical protein